jgi:hypothetical protein
MEYLSQTLSNDDRCSIFNRLGRFQDVEENSMDLDDFMITVFCWIDAAIPAALEGHRLRQRGPAPTLWDSAVLPMEGVGAYLSLEQDTALFAYFQRHDAPFFPALRTLHRTTFVRPAAHLWRLQERVWPRLVAQTPPDPHFALVDSFALPVGLFARAYRCQRFGGEAAYGKDHLTRQTFSGFRVPARVCWPGVITRICLAPANGAELAVIPDLAAQTSGWLVGDRHDWQPTLIAELAAQHLALLAPFRWATRDPHPRFATQIAQLRYRIDTVFGQLVERTALKRVWAHDLWHLCSRVLRTVLMPTLAGCLHRALGHPPLQLAQVVA